MKDNGANVSRVPHNLHTRALLPGGLSTPTSRPRGAGSRRSRLQYAPGWAVYREPGVLGPVPQPQLHAAGDRDIRPVRLERQRDNRVRIPNGVDLAIL